MAGTPASYSALLASVLEPVVVFPSVPGLQACGRSWEEILFSSPHVTVENLIEQAKRDLLADGLDIQGAAFVLELDMLYGGQFHVKRTLSAAGTLRSEDLSDAAQELAASGVTQIRILGGRSGNDHRPGRNRARSLGGELLYLGESARAHNQCGALL